MMFWVRGHVDTGRRYGNHTHTHVHRDTEGGVLEKRGCGLGQREREDDYTHTLVMTKRQ